MGNCFNPLFPGRTLIVLSMYPAETYRIIVELGQCAKEVRHYGRAIISTTKGRLRREKQLFLLTKCNDRGIALMCQIFQWQRHVLKCYTLLMQNNSTFRNTSSLNKIQHFAEGYIIAALQYIFKV